MDIRTNKTYERRNSYGKNSKMDDETFKCKNRD